MHGRERVGVVVRQHLASGTDDEFEPASAIGWFCWIAMSNVRMVALPKEAPLATRMSCCEIGARKHPPRYGDAICLMSQRVTVTEVTQEERRTRQQTCWETATDLSWNGLCAINLGAGRVHDPLRERSHELA